MTEPYLIWSHEHGAWWGPGRHGYVQAVADAGRYSHAQAMAICADAMPGNLERLGVLPELPVREADAVALVTSYRGETRPRT